MLGRAISYPKEGAGSWKTIGIGGVLLFPLVAIFIIPMLLAMGYLVRATDAAVRGADAPAFGEWGDLLVDGIKLFVVGLVYFIVPTVLYFVGFVLTVESFPTNPPTTAQTAPEVGSAGLTGPLLLLGSFLLFMVIGYFTPAGVANFAYKDRLGAAFSVGEVVDTAIDSDYFVALLLVVLLNVGLGIVVTVLTLLTFGIFYVAFVFLGSFVQFYLQVASLYLVGRGYARSRGIDRDRSAGPTADVADPRVE